jgi:hypothetical protein
MALLTPSERPGITQHAAGAVMDARWLIHPKLLTRLYIKAIHLPSKHSVYLISREYVDALNSRINPTKHIYASTHVASMVLR